MLKLCTVIFLQYNLVISKNGTQNNTENHYILLTNVIMHCDLDCLSNVTPFIKSECIILS